MAIRICGLWFCIVLTQATAADPFVAVLGTAQDGGLPQAGCRRECCQSVWNEPQRQRYVSCVALVDPDSQQRWLFDCTPNFPQQLHLLDKIAPQVADRPLIDGILPTHAHVGHYAGLIHLGREVIGAERIPVMAMPRMRFFLETNGPWNQMVRLQQIQLQRLADGQPFVLNKRLTITPILVPHRDEYSETVGFLIDGPQRNALYLPDIDKWERWGRSIEAMIAQVDVAFVDGTFFDGDELPGRDMARIPHPFVTESLKRFRGLPIAERQKIRFIHLNHTNKLHNPASTEHRILRAAGMSVAEQVNPEREDWLESQAIFRL